MTTVFWERFQCLCEGCQVSPNGVCRVLGFSNAAATHWKQGKVPGAESLIKIANYFNCSVDYLLGRDNFVRNR